MSTFAQLLNTPIAPPKKKILKKYTCSESKHRVTIELFQDKMLNLGWMKTAAVAKAVEKSRENTCSLLRRLEKDGYIQSKASSVGRNPSLEWKWLRISPLLESEN